MSSLMEALGLFSQAGRREITELSAEWATEWEDILGFSAIQNSN